MPISTVTLRTGDTVPKPALKTTCIALRELGPIEAYEAVELARNPRHQLFGDCGQVLQNLGLLSEDGTMHDVTRSVILAAAEGSDLNLHFVNPL